jgi:glucan biosynthesis protein C
MYVSGDDSVARGSFDLPQDPSIEIWNGETERVQTMRGLACILLVSFHVIGSTDASGLRVDADSSYRLFADYFTFVRMPLFTFLSGFVYAYRSVMAATIGAFFVKKLRRLYLPLVTASTIFFFGHLLLRDGTPPTRLPDIWRIFLFSYQHFWFLQALIVIFFLVALMDSVGALSTLGRYIFALAASLALLSYQPFDSSELFSVSQAIYLLPFFLLGLGANRYRRFFFSPAMVRVAIAAFLVGHGVHAYGFLATADSFQDRHSLIAILVGFSTTLLAVRYLPRQHFLAYIGAYSFAIYLYHPIFAAAVRIAGDRLGEVPLSALFWLGLTAGIAGPVLVEKFARRRRVTRALVLGLK